jgi:hypothetical protein
MQVAGTGGVARKTEASRGALQRAIATCDGNPLVDERTGARHADGRLGGLGSEHCYHLGSNSHPQGMRHY